MQIIEQLKNTLTQSDHRLHAISFNENMSFDEKFLLSIEILDWRKMIKEIIKSLEVPNETPSVY